MCYRQKLILSSLLLCYLGFQPARANVNPASKDTLRLSLQQIWQQAESQNKKVKISQLKINSSAENLKDARSERLPEINAATKYARISNLPIYENGILNKPDYFPVIHNYFQLNAEASVTVYNGQKLKNRVKEEEVENEISAIEKNMTVSDVKFKATAYYLELERNLHFKKLVKVNITEQQKRLDQILELFKNGVILRSDVLRAELSLSKQKMLLIEIENTIAINNQKLDVLIGMSEEIFLNPAEETDDKTDSVKIYDDYLNDAFSNAYGIRISEKETELKQLDVKIIKANSLPKVTAYAEYGYTYPQIFLYPYAVALYGLGQAGVKISYSISSIYQNKHKIKSAEIQAEKQHLVHQDEEDVLRTEVNEAYVRYNESLKRIRVSEENIHQATETYRIVYNTYFNQLALLTDLLDADTQLLQSKFDLTSAQIRAKLEYYYLMKTIGNL